MQSCDTDSLRVDTSIPYTSRSLWNPLEAFFEAAGYRLFVHDENNPEYDVPRNAGEIRSPDPFHVFISGQEEPSRFRCSVSGLAVKTVLELFVVVIDWLHLAEQQALCGYFYERW